MELCVKALDPFTRKQKKPVYLVSSPGSVLIGPVICIAWLWAAVTNYCRPKGLNHRNLLLTFLKAEGPRSKQWRSGVWWVCFLICRWLSFVVSANGREQREREQTLSFLLRRVLVYFAGALTLQFSHHLWHSSHWCLGFQHMDLGKGIIDIQFRTLAKLPYLSSLQVLHAWSGDCNIPVWGYCYEDQTRYCIENG